MLRILNLIIQKYRRKISSFGGSAKYWSTHMVVNKRFLSSKESMDYFDWRNAIYPGYIELMPVSGQDGKIVLDYGCGPGNDLVGFSIYSNPAKLIGVDVSPKAIGVAKERLDLHNRSVEFILINELDNRIPLPSKSVDYIHTSGVLHHCANLELVLAELHRVLKDDGFMAVMVYNYSSIYVHLYVAYMLKLKSRKNSEMNLQDVFRMSSDGGYVPISKYYKPEEFISLMDQYGFNGTFKGASISLRELQLLEKRFDALADENFPKEHRDFLSALTFNDRGIPLFQDEVAGINACYLFKKR